MPHMPIHMFQQLTPINVAVGLLFVGGCQKLLSLITHEESVALLVLYIASRDFKC